jgi:CRISPR-associated protein Cas1
MVTVGGRNRSTPRELTRAVDRLSFVYLERCTVHRDANAITAEDAEGTIHIPSATIGTLLLGPGTRVTHQAMSVLGESGAGVVWVGEHGVRFYAGGRSLTRSSALAEAHATQWANRRARLEVARAMYGKRFPDEDPAGLTRREGERASGSKTATVKKPPARVLLGADVTMCTVTSVLAICPTRPSLLQLSACTGSPMS